MERMRCLSSGETATSGAFIYWMTRDYRVEDHWGLYYAMNMAIEAHVPLEVIWVLAPEFVGPSKRQRTYLLEVLHELSQVFQTMNVPVHLLYQVSELETWLIEKKPSRIMMELNPLRPFQQALENLLVQQLCPIYEVDAHNIVPLWVASDHAEYGAYTLRPKIQRVLERYLIPVPAVPFEDMISHQKSFNIENEDIELQLQAASRMLIGNREIEQEVSHLDHRLLVKSHAIHRFFNEFVQGKLEFYHEHGNDPSVDVVSQMSPYLHFGRVYAGSVARILKDIQLENQTYTSSIEDYLEQLIVRRELADNFCYYHQDYDQTSCFPNWAMTSLNEHLIDIREYLYDFDTFRQARTHDSLWNASMMQLLKEGRIHGYMRMYWAKKILEWTRSPEEAQRFAIELNDTYSLDGYDPNGYTNIAWSIGGVHDRAWQTRQVFGKIRYMNANGCKRKFDANAYVSRYH